MKIRGGSWLVNLEENGCRLEVRRDEHWIHTRPRRLIAVRDSLLEFFVTKLALMFQYALALDVIHVLDGS